MTRHVSKEMQRIKRIGYTLYVMDDAVWCDGNSDRLTREAVAEVMAATPEDRQEACWHVGLTDDKAKELASTAEETVSRFDMSWLDDDEEDE